MVTKALDRLDVVLVEAGQPGLKKQLADGRSARDVRQELEAQGLSNTDDLVAWFSYHDGGWLEPMKMQLLSFDEAIDHRMDLSQDLLVPFRSTWFPFRTDSTESYVVDTATGAVMHYDLETGADGARQLARSLAAWIDGISKDTGSRFGVSIGRTRSKQWSSTDELRDDAQRALRGLAGFARRAADWIDDKEAALGAPQSDDQSDDKADTAVEAGVPYSPAPGVAPDRAAVEASVDTWLPARGEVGLFEELADGRIAVMAHHAEGVDLYVLDPARHLTAELVAEIPEQVWSQDLAVSPVTAKVLVNGAWLYDVDAKTGGRVEGLFGQPFRLGTVKASWASDGRYIHLHKSDHKEIVSESPDGELVFETIGPMSQILDVETGALVTHTIGEGDGPPALHGAYLVASVQRDDDEYLRITTVEGAAIAEVEVGTFFRVFPSAALLSSNGAKLAVPSFGQRGFVLVDLATGDTKIFQEEHPLGIAADGATILAIKADYPTSPCFVIHTADHSIEPFGSPQIDHAHFDWSADGTRYVHHVIGPGRSLSIEYIDWSRGVSSIMPMWSNEPEESAVDLRICGDAVVYFDRRSPAAPTYVAAPIVAGELGAKTDFGDDSRARPGLQISIDEQHLVWSTDRGLRWCSPDASGLTALLVSGKEPHEYTWTLTRANQIIVKTATQIDMATMS